MPERPPNRVVLSVSQLNAQVSNALEQGFPPVWVEGEVSNIVQPASGHWYLTLKDEAAQVRCAMFRHQNRKVEKAPENGDRVLVKARIGLYVARGDYQLILEAMEPAGDGALRRAFEQLRRKLEAEGLFDPEIKRPIPAWPVRLGVITSPTGAALRDILAVLRRRFPNLEVIVYPSAVQGADAPPQLIAALETAARRAECDSLILARGGGSLEDLMAFNDEALARAIRACPIPVICGIGHEIDLTIADMAADLRAPTPTAAAELATPDRDAWRKRVANNAVRLQRNFEQLLEAERENLRHLDKRLQQRHPGRQVEQRMLRIDELELRLFRSMSHRHRALANSIAAVARTLHAVSPLATLGRGYAILRQHRTGELIKTVANVAERDIIEAQLVDGVVRGEVSSVTPVNRKK